MGDVMDRVPRQHHINGQWVGEPSLEVINPATGEVLAAVADADVATAVSALDAAAEAQASWAETAPRERAELLRAAYERIIEQTDDFATLMTLEMGKPLEESRGEVAYGADYFRWFSEEAVRIHGRFGVAPSGAQRIITKRVPVGPVFAITPWNFPLAMATRKIGPALAAGCTSVLKPASATPLTALLLAKVLEDVGVPSGVVNVFVTSNTKETSSAIIDDPRLRKLTFTGSTSVGQGLLEQASKNVLRTSMELGGNAPFIVLEGTDLDAAVEGALIAKMRNNGEACTAANRFYVAKSIAEEFVAKLEARLLDWRMGPGLDDGVQLGALIHEGAVEDIVELIDDAVAKGAEVRVGGKAEDGPGAFLPATLLTNVAEDSRIVEEEIFGPVVAVQTFDTVDEVIERANATNFGLMSYVFGEESEAFRVAERLDYGLCGVNTGKVSDAAAPFGGIKHSGLGREGSFEGIDEYLETRYFGMPL